MQLPPVFLVLTAVFSAFGISQTLTPTAYAQAASAKPLLRAAVEGLQSRRAAGGVEVTGTLTNTGRQPLSYPALVCVFLDKAGEEVGRTDGYLTAGPVAPGQSAGFRAVAAAMPAFAAVSVSLREAGRNVPVQPVPVQPPAPLAASRRTTVR